MADLQTVCCMCGDVGFPDKLFRCTKCHYRFQHSYCSSYYGKSLEPIRKCDWCQSEERTIRNGSTLKQSVGSNTRAATRPECSCKRIKQSHDEEESQVHNGKKNKSSLSSPRRTISRRYKLLKDVMC